MKKNGFTLIELLSVIIILGITITIVAVKVDNNIKNANEFDSKNTINVIENAALIYSEDYSKELSNKNVDLVTLETLINKGLLPSKKVKNISKTNVVLIANVNGNTKVKYIETSKNVIFLNGSSEISINKDKSYEEMGAYVAIPNVGVEQLSLSNITSSVDTTTIGKYEVTYTYTNATTVKRIVNVI